MALYDDIIAVSSGHHYHHNRGAFMTKTTRSSLLVVAPSSTAPLRPSILLLHLLRLQLLHHKEALRVTSSEAISSSSPPHLRLRLLSQNTSTDSLFMTVMIYWVMLFVEVDADWLIFFGGDEDLHLSVSLSHSLSQSGRPHWWLWSHITCVLLLLLSAVNNERSPTARFFRVATSSKPPIHPTRTWWLNCLPAHPVLHCSLVCDQCQF